MQRLPIEVISQAKKENIKLLDKELRDFLAGCVAGERITCPICNYQSSRNKTSALVFKNNRDLAFKCFACGVWRRFG